MTEGIHKMSDRQTEAEHNVIKGSHKLNER
jgi:hypothetical protein